MSSKKRKPRRPRRKFTEEFKADVVRLCRVGGESIGEVSRRLDLTESAVRAWVEQAGVDEVGGTAEALTTDEREELAKLRRENKRLLMERDILKNYLAAYGTTWGGETRRQSPMLRSPWAGAAAVSFLVHRSPLKNVVQGTLRT